jgi:hypothetical protein
MTRKIRFIIFFFTTLITIWAFIMIIGLGYAMFFKATYERARMEFFMLSIFPTIIFIVFGIISNILYRKIKQN